MFWALVQCLIALWALVLRVSFCWLAKCREAWYYLLASARYVQAIVHQMLSKGLLGKEAIPLGGGAANLRCNTSGLGHSGVATSFLATLPILRTGDNGWVCFQSLLLYH